MNSIYSFCSSKADGNLSMDGILGGKGAGLAHMCAMGLPVPPGFTITSDVCILYYKNSKELPPALMPNVKAAIKTMEQSLGKKFGGTRNPMLVSVRSGAKVSMPGMMDTILNLGLNDQTVTALAATHNNERFALDSYRRFIQMYACVVLGMKLHQFEALLSLKKQEQNIEQETDLTIESLEQLVAEFKALVLSETGKDFPQDVWVQLNQAIKAVFDSWMSARAVTYRKIHGITEEHGTAVNVQAMVFGNMDDKSATGVLFTRNPSTGENTIYGEYLLNAQGEDVVAGIRTPAPLSAMQAALPQVYNELVTVAKKLEAYHKDMQDIEFTVEQGKLWILQARSGKRTIEAGIKILVDMVSEKLIDKEDAILRIEPLSLNQLLYPRLDPKANKTVIAKGMPASPGAVSGSLVFTAEDAEQRAMLGEKVILVCTETSPEDIHGMHAAEGILTSCGGMTSHAAVVARGMGKVCIVGAKDLRIDREKKTLRVSTSDVVVKEHDIITVDGQSGEVLLGIVPAIKPAPPAAFITMMQWADQLRKLKVRTNAETVEDIQTALAFGAEGVGLCRTEHMFFEPKRIVSVRKMIIANSLERRVQALKEILSMQRSDFAKIFRLMAGKPVNIRLLDMPLHEFIPKTEEEINLVANSGQVSSEFVTDRCKQLHEFNPMLGHRGCRLAITYPEIYEMQARAIFEAMAEILQSKMTCLVEIMVPLVANDIEIKLLRNLIDSTALKVQEETKVALQYKVGTMIELPRAALCSDKIAAHVDYVSYGTNDLSQTTFGLSRDDSASFMSHYLACGILTKDPFVELDEDGVGELIKISLAKAKSAKPAITAGICGEHGGDPKSIRFFNSLGLDYVSCSPYRIQVAKLAAAQAELMKLQRELWIRDHAIAS
jgi:pyruvate,orthophosphate dikinase